MLKINYTDKDSVGYELGLKPNDIITHFDNFPAEDVLDYFYYDSKESFSMSVTKASGENLTFEVEKYIDESLGLEFLDNNLGIKTCHNNCIFCFVRQMPKGLRPSLYIKDDDYRQSFMCGNFVTLTNVNDSDIERIIRLNLSPLYVSVHTMNGELRDFMTNNRFAHKITEYIPKLVAGGITINTQVVLVKDVNDGKELAYTARQLFKQYPNVPNMAVVPCGITRFREGLTSIENLTGDYALSIIEQTDNLNKEFGCDFIQIADEFYFSAKKHVKPYEFYGDFAQIENGVGTTAKFEYEVLLSMQESKSTNKPILVTGVSAKNYICSLIEKVKSTAKSINPSVKQIENDFFGHTINCVGLLTGGDILKQVNQMQDKTTHDYLILPNVCLKQDSDVFLDGMNLCDLQTKLNMPIVVTDGSGESFFSSLTLDKSIFDDEKIVKI